MNYVSLFHTLKMMQCCLVSTRIICRDRLLKSEFGEQIKEVACHLLFRLRQRGGQSSLRSCLHGRFLACANHCNSLKFPKAFNECLQIYKLPPQLTQNMSHSGHLELLKCQVFLFLVYYLLSNTSPPLCFIIRSVTSTGTNFYSVFLSKFNAGSKYFSQFWKTVDTLERKFKWQLGWCVLRSCVQKVTPLTCLFHLLICRQSALIVTYVPGTREHCSLHCNFLDNLLFL